MKHLSDEQICRKDTPVIEIYYNYRDKNSWMFEYAKKMRIKERDKKIQKIKDKLGEWEK